MSRLLEARLIDLIVGTDPAAGSEISVTVPAGESWLLYTFRATLTTDATVANRVAAVLLDNGSTIGFHAHVNLAHTASVTFNYSWSVGGPYTGQVGNFAQSNLPTPPFALRAGWRIRTSTTNFAAGDNWTSPAMFVARFSPSDLAQFMQDIDDEIRSAYGFGG